MTGGEIDRLLSLISSRFDSLEARLAQLDMLRDYFDEKHQRLSRTVDKHREALDAHREEDRKCFQELKRDLKTISPKVIAVFSVIGAMLINLLWFAVSNYIGIAEIIGMKK